MNVTMNRYLCGILGCTVARNDQVELVTENSVLTKSGTAVVTCISHED